MAKKEHGLFAAHKRKQFGFAKGYTPWNKGLTGIKTNSPGKLSPFKGTKGLMKSNKTSFKKGLTPWNKGIKFEAIRGEKNHNWKGGISKVNKGERQLFMETVEYKVWRRAVFERDNYTCQLCNKKKEVSGKLHADHIKAYALYPDLRIEITNGRTLCERCHVKTETYGNRKRIML